MLLYGDPLVAFWTGPWTRTTVAAWADAMVERWADDGVGKWMAHERSDGTLVGRGGFSRIELDGETVLELGWVVRDALAGRGYATESGGRPCSGRRRSSRTCPSSPSPRCTTGRRRR